jgi:hypothetical protein
LLITGFEDAAVHIGVYAVHPLSILLLFIVTEPLKFVDADTISEPVISTNPAFCTYKLLPLFKYNDELLADTDELIVVNDTTVNEPVMVWFPTKTLEAVVAALAVNLFNDAVAVFTLEVNVLINEPVAITLAVKVLTDEVNVLSIEPVALSDAVNAFILDVKVLINEPVAITLAVNEFELVANVLNSEELKNGVTTANEEVVAKPKLVI